MPVCMNWGVLLCVLIIGALLLGAYITASDLGQLSDRHHREPTQMVVLVIEASGLAG